MDPYLERHWGDVHASLINQARDQIQAALPAGLRARIQERVYVELPAGEAHSLYPDIRLVEHGTKAKLYRPSTGTLVADEPLVIRYEGDPITEEFIEIVDIGSGRRVVSVVEFLSPANKLPGKGHRLYRKKQRECRKGRVNLVEIDLIRQGRRVLMIGEENIPDLWRTAYQVGVFRPGADPSYEVYRAPLQARLPVIRIPLRPKDADILLDLQAALNAAYLKGAYDGDIDYEKEPIPPLNPADAKWADALLREKCYRKAKRPRGAGRNGKGRKVD
jgi:hypothetical protein